MVYVFIVMFLVTVVISWLWANAIDKMPKDYKGEDFLNWDRENDGWDENKNHTEGQI